jgi:hypothetical protein
MVVSTTPDSMIDDAVRHFVQRDFQLLEFKGIESDGA